MSKIWKLPLNFGQCCSCIYNHSSRLYSIHQKVICKTILQIISFWNCWLVQCIRGWSMFELCLRPTIISTLNYTTAYLSLVLTWLVYKSFGVDLTEVRWHSVSHRQCSGNWNFEQMLSSQVVHQVFITDDMMISARKQKQKGNINFKNMNNNSLITIINLLWVLGVKDSPRIQ